MNNNTKQHPIKTSRRLIQREKKLVERLHTLEIPLVFVLGVAVTLAVLGTAVSFSLTMDKPIDQRGGGTVRESVIQDDFSDEYMK